MANTVIIHIGVPKTGSTAIQKFLFQNKEYLLKNGLEYHETYANGDDNPDYWAHHLLAHKWGGWMDSGTFPIQPETAWENLRKDVLVGDNRTILISSERFSDLFASKNINEILEFIKSTLSPAKIKILAYTRNQTVLVESFYKQQVKVGIEVPPLKLYLEKQMPEFLDFFNLFEECSNLIGRENIMVHSYENDLVNDSNIIYSFVKACGLVLSKELFSDTKKYNTSTSTLSTALLSHPDLKKTQQRRRYRNAIRNLFDEAVTKSGMPASLLSDGQRSYVAEMYDESNKNLEKFYSRDNNELSIRLDKVRGVSSLENEKFLLSYDEIVDFLKVFNEDLEDLS